MAERDAVALGQDDPMTLVELVNRVVDRGVVLRGEVTLSVADIDLLYLGVDLLLCSVERAERGRAEVDDVEVGEPERVRVTAGEPEQGGGDGA